jgi:hypothetical protein
MCRIVAGFLILLLVLPALGDQDKTKDKPKTPKEQYKALLKEQNDARKAFQDAYQTAKTQEEKNKVVQEKYPNPDKLAPKFLELAEKNPKDPIAIEALTWLVLNARDAGKDDSRAKAMAILLRDHVQSVEMGLICTILSSRGYDRKERDLLLGILDKNPNKMVQAEACLALAEVLSHASQAVREIKEDSEMAKRYEQSLGKELVEELQKADAAKLDAESARYFKDFGEKYSARMPRYRLISTSQTIARRGGAGGEVLLRAFLEKDVHRDVQGVACLALAQSLKRRADALPEVQAKYAEKMRRQSEELFERATNTYADVKLPFEGTVGGQAKGELFELRYLSIGKVVPEVEGEDADSKKFKLSDYRGKVVLLDFWGHW